MATRPKFEIPPNVDPALLKLQALQQLLSAQEAVANAQWYVRHVPNMTDEPRKIAEAAEALRAAVAAFSSDCQPQDGDYQRTGRELTE